VRELFGCPPDLQLKKGPLARRPLSYVTCDLQRDNTPLRYSPTIQSSLYSMLSVPGESTEEERRSSFGGCQNKTGPPPFPVG
jgi:hypothetical protein